MNIKRTFAIVTMLGAAVLLMTACGKKEKNDSLLYRISGKGLEKPSYIFGTHHLAPIGVLDNVPGLPDAFDSTDAMVGELLMTDMAALQAELIKHMSMPEGVTYRDILSEEDYAFLDEAMEVYMGAGLDMLGRMHPVALTTMMTQIIYKAVLPPDNASQAISMDQQAQMTAQAQNKKIIGLETVEDQVNALFYSEPVEVKAKSLVSMIRHAEFTEKSILQLNEYYEAQDLDGLYDLAFNNPDDPDPVSEEYAFALNKERNDRWMKKIPAIMAEQPSFIMVGALHLPGDEGLLNQLRKKGYKVEAVK